MPLPRPKPSDAVREFSAEFAQLVTVSSERSFDMVARTGKLNMYTALSLCASKVLQRLCAKFSEVPFHPEDGSNNLHFIPGMSE